MRIRKWDLFPRRGDWHSGFADGPKHTDSWVMWPSGTIAWDFPERVPQYVKEAVAAQILKAEAR